MRMCIYENAYDLFINLIHALTTTASRAFSLTHSLTLLNIEKFENIYILLPVDDIKTAVQTRKFYRICLMTNLVKERSEYGSEEKMVTAILLN